MPPPLFPRPVQAAIFDFDETLIDLEPQHTAAYVALCRAMGSDYFEMPEEFRHGSGRRIIDDVRMMRAHFGWRDSEDALLARRLTLFDEECRSADLQLLPGAEPALRSLHARAVRMAVTSSAVRSSIAAILERFGLLDCFELIVDGSEVVVGKPDPEAYLVTAARLGVTPAGCVVFEDSTVGVQAAKAAGMFCVAVRNPQAKTDQDLSPADIELGSLLDLDVSWFAE
ncbi:MAG: HAD family phosphatase [Thermoanaerobaculia bacterium]